MAILFANFGEEKSFLKKRRQKEKIMDTLHSVAHLQREIGDEAFNALISSDNTEVVRQFAQGLAEKALPTEMTVGDRTYEILSFLQGDEKSVNGHVMVDRARKMKANLGHEDGGYILGHQREIPTALRAKVVFIFTEWHDHLGRFACILWRGDCWVLDWNILAPVLDKWHGHDRLIRCK